MATNLLVCLVLFAAASAVPLMRDDFDSDLPNYQCARQCKRSSKFNYQADTTYIYQYKAEADTSVAGASEDKARMHIETHAKIEVINECEFALRIQDVQLSHSKPYSDSMKPAENMHEFQRELTENSIRFSFDDGIIRDICHPSQEKIWVLNFKKGLLSAFQNSMDDLQTDQKVMEIDVTGECQTEYTKKKEWIWERSIKLSKTKDLLACYQHSGIRSLIPMVPYRVASNIQSLPIMKSSHECDYVVSSSRILKSAVCTENHVFAPFSNHQSGGATKVQQTLTFVTSKRGVETRQDNIDVRTNLLFKHINGIDNVQNTRRVAEQKLKEICDQTRVDVRPETPRLFNEIVQSVKDMESSELRDLYNMVKNKRLCRQNEKAMKFLLDSLPIAGTKAAVELMITVINNDEIPDFEKTVWFASLSLIPEPTEDMLPSIMKLLNGDYAMQAMLPVSSLLNTMCRKNVDCEQSSQFQRVVKKLNQNIDYSCTSDDKAQLMETLRAIGNIGYGKDFLNTLKTCLTSRYASLDVKVAAADAHRRFQCQENEETGVLMEVLEAKNADSELRIMSFLSLMRCPRDSVLQKIAAQLKREEDVHVGTFIYTHLESLKQTSDPHKQDIAEAVRRLDLRPFEDSGFKTSRSHESSSLINRLNLGYVANGDLIWSQNSMMPRAMRVNLTVEMFGNSINFFEAGARMDGLERFIQRYFGTEGYFSQNKAAPEDLEAFVYARMFGNELFFKQVKGSHEYEKAKSHLNFDKLLENLSQKYDFKYTHSQELMDQSLIIPTVIGLPVNMTMNASMTLDTDTRGKVDFSGILSRSKPITVTSNVAASAGLEVTGSMMVDAMLYKQGVRMRNTLHSSVNLRANLMIKNRQIVDFEIESPEEKQEIVDARSQFFIVHDNFEKEQDMIKENRKELQGCTGDRFSQVTGVELCGELQYPNATMVEDAPYFPLTGPVRATLIMNKKDTQRTYKIFAKWIKNSKKLEAQFQLDTPGSQVDRHISADVTIGVHKNPHVDVVLISPWKKIVLNGKAARNNDIASLTGNVVVDNNKQYKLTSEVKMQENIGGIEFKPFVEIENGKERITLLKGTLTYMDDIQAELEVQDWSKQLYTIETLLINNSEEKKIDMSAGRKGDKPYRFKIGTTYKLPNKKNQNIRMNPEILIQIPKGQILSWKSYGEFQPEPMKLAANMTFDTMLVKQPFSFNVDVAKKKKSYPVDAKLKTSMGSADLKGRIEMVNKNTHKVDMKVQYKVGSQKDIITLVGKLNDKSRTHYSQFKMKSTLKFKNMPEYNSVSIMDIIHKKKTSAKLNVHFTESQKNNKRKQPDIQAFVTLYTDIKNLYRADIQADLTAKMPEKDVDIKMMFDHKHSSKKLGCDLELRLAPLVENDINANIRIQDKGRSLLDITADGNVEVYGKKYSVKSELVQKSKRGFEHSISLTDDQQEKHSLHTIYRNTNNRHEINAEIDSPQLIDPLKLEVSADLKEPSDFHIRGALNENYRELYYLEALSKLEGVRAGKWNLELAHPTRKVKGQVGFTKFNNRLKTDAYVNWNVNSQEQPAPEVRVTSHFTQNFESDSVSLKGNVKLSTPFKNFEEVSSNVNFEKSDSQLRSTGIIKFDKTRKQIASIMSAKLPISLEKAKIDLTVKTPFKNYEDIEIKLDHKLDSDIKTLLKARVNNDKSEVIVKGTKDTKFSSKHIQAKVTMKTPYQSFRRIVMNVDHVHDEKKIRTTAMINKEGEKYNVDFHLSGDNQWSNTEKNGHLILSGPKQSAEASLTIKVQNKRTHFEAAITSAEKNMKNKYSVDLKGSYLDLIHHRLNVDVKTPFKDAKQIGLQIGNEIGRKQIKSKVVLEFNHDKVGYDISLKNKQQDKSADVSLYLTPLSESKVPLQLKSRLQFNKYPVTVSGQISWAPTSVVGFTGSYKAQSIDNLEVGLTVTTPFKYQRNINLVVSNVLRNSVRVSRLNLDVDSKTVMNVEVTTQNGDERKSLRIQIYLPSSQFQSLNTGISLDLTKGLLFKADSELQLTSEDKYEATMGLNLNGVKDIRGKITIKTPIEGVEKIDGSFVRGESNDEKQSSLILTSGDEKLVEIKAETDVKEDRVTIKIITEGKLLPHILKAVDELHILPKLHKDSDGNEIQRLFTEVKVMEQDKTVQIGGSLITDFGKSKQKMLGTLRITGEHVYNIDMYVSLSHNQRSMQGTLVLKLVDDVQIQAIVIDPFENKHGVEYTHACDSYKSEYKGKLHLNEFRNFESSIEVYVSNTQRIELVSATKTDIRGYEITKIKYILEGQDNRVSSSFNVENMKGIHTSIDLIGQTSPINLVSLIVKTPLKEYRKLVISGDFDETKFNGLIELNEGKQLSLSGVHNNFKNPQLTLKTPLRQLQVLSINNEGEMSDGSSSFTLKFNDYDQIDGRVALKHKVPSNVNIFALLNTRIDQSENSLKFEMETTTEPKRTKLHISLNDVDQIKYEAEMESVSSYENRHSVNFEMRYPSLGSQTQGIVLRMKGDNQNSNGRIQLLGQSEEIVDADIKIQYENEMKASLIVHKPQRMEYIFTRENFQQTNENELYFNWDRNDPKANLVIKASFKDDSTSNRLDKSVSLRLSCPRRSVGVQHSISATNTELQTKGKIYWNDDRESQLSYELQLEDKSNRRHVSYHGNAEVKLPTRTIGLAGYAMDQSDERQAETTFSWDMDNDKSKKIGMKVKLQKGSYTQADVSLILPKDAHVDSKLVMNKGNTILEGETQIFYSEDSKKTLTLFSRVENNPGQSSFFFAAEDKYNYSIQLGLSHPESHVDVKMVSHLGVDSERLTTSVGIDYLTSRKQIKNMDLFMEINRIKKEMNLRAVTPYKNVGLTGAISQNPMELKAITTVDDQKAVSAHLLVDQDQKKVKFDYTNGNIELQYSAGFPNKTALLLQRKKTENGEVNRDIMVLIQLASPQLLKTDLQWKPGMLKDLRDRVFYIVKQSTNNLKDLSEEVASDVQAEVSAKYTDIAPSLIDVIKGVVISVEQELSRIEDEFDQMQRGLSKDFDFCGAEIGDIDLDKEIRRLQQKLQEVVEKLNKMVKSYTQNYRDTLRTWSEVLEMLKDLQADEFYQIVINKIGIVENKVFKTFFWDFLRMLHDLSPEVLEDIWKILHDIVERQYDPQEIIEDLNEAIEEIKNMKITSLITKTSEKNFEITSKLKIIIKKLSSFVSDHPYTQQVVDIIQEHANEFYQVARWSINYLEIGNNLPRHLENMADYINEIIEEELKEQMGPVYRYIRNPVTKFNPKQGVLQAEFPLAITIDRLDKMPTVLQITQKVANYVEQNFGSKSSTLLSQATRSRFGKFDQRRLTKAPYEGRVFY